MILPKKKLIFVVAFTVSATLAYCLVSWSAGIPANVWANLLTVFLLAGIPALSIIGALHRKEDGARRTPSLLRTYAVLITLEFLLAMAAFDLLMAQTGDFDWTGFHLLGPGLFLLWLAILLIGLFLIDRGANLVRARGWLWARQEPSVIPPRPPTMLERRLWYFAVAPLAGILEEFLYRGYLFNEIPNLWRTHPLACAWVASSLAFGLARVQKDLSRLWGAIITGFLMGCPVVFSGSIFPSMAARALYSAARSQFSSHGEITSVPAPDPQS